MRAVNIFLVIATVTVVFSCGDKKEHRKQQFLLKGNEAYNNQNQNSAIHYYTEAIKVDSCYVDALNNLATIYYTQNKLDEALHLYERSASCDPTFYRAHLNLSNTLYDLKQYYRGADVLSKQLALYPDSADLYFGLGMHLTKLRDYDSATVMFERAFKREPGNAEILVNLGTLHYYQQDLDQANDRLNQALELDPKESEAYNTLALVAVEEKSYQKALDHIDNAIQIKDEAHYLNNKGYILLQLDKFDEAQELIDESIIIDPMNGWAFRNKAIIKLEQNQPEEAISLLKRADKLDDYIEDINYYLGEAYLQMEQKAMACQYFEKGHSLKEKKSVTAHRIHCN